MYRIDSGKTRFTPKKSVLRRNGILEKTNENTAATLKDLSAEPKFYNEQVFKSDEIVQAYYHFSYKFGGFHTHCHNFHELNVVIKGSGKHFIGEKAFDVSKGSVFVIPPFVNHSYTFDSDDFVVFHILFKNKFFDKYEQALRYVSGYNIFFDIEPFLRLNMSENSLLPKLTEDKFSELSPSFSLMSEYEQEADAPQQKKEFLALFIIAALCENIEYQSGNVSNGGFELYYMMKTTEFLQNNFDKKLNLTELFQQANMSRSTFLRNFKKYYGVTPSEYQTQYRIKQAKAMLSGTDKNITTIAHDCGFFDCSHFIRIFRDKTGISPLAFRNSAQKQEE